MSRIQADPVWMDCASGRGYPRTSSGSMAPAPQTFPENTVGLLHRTDEHWLLVEFVHKQEWWLVDRNEASSVDMSRQFWHESDPDRICNTCLRLLPKSDFGKDNKRADGTYQTRPACKQCKRAVTKNPKAALTEEEEARRPQHGHKWQCPVCQHVFIVGVTARVTMDHDHDTGAFRDFICDRCNTGMGRFRNGVDALIHVAEYLEGHGAKR